MLVCENISCIRNNKILFHNFNFNFDLGSITLITGNNGIGKTSLLKIISGLMKPSSGIIKFNSHNIYSDLTNYMSSIVYIGHQNAFNNHLTVLENIEFWAKLGDNQELIEPAIHYLELNPVADILYMHLSAGWKRRVALSRLLLSNKHMWFIDEPLVNLDTHARTLIIELITIRRDQDGIIILTGHESLGIDDYKTINLSDFK